jgi:hypothetical protein
MGLLISGGLYFYFQKPVLNPNIKGASRQVVVDQQQTVTLEIKSGGSYTLPYKAQESTFSFLQRLDEQDSNFSFEYQEYSGLGNFVTTINGIKADSTKEFWKFTVNGTESSVGIDQYQVKPGDKLGFELTSFTI